MDPKSLDERRLSFKTFEMDLILQTPHLHNMARSLTIHEYSGMNRAMNHYQSLLGTRPIDAKGIFAFYDEIHIGWVLLTYEKDDMSFRPKPGHACVQVYVRPDYRRNGVGAKLLRMAEQIKTANTVINVYLHDEPDFFAPFILTNNFQSVYQE